MSKLADDADDASVGVGVRAARGDPDDHDFPLDHVERFDQLLKVELLVGCLRRELTSAHAPDAMRQRPVLATRSWV